MSQLVAIINSRVPVLVSCGGDSLAVVHIQPPALSIFSELSGVTIFYLGTGGISLCRKQLAVYYPGLFVSLLRRLQLLQSPGVNSYFFVHTDNAICSLQISITAAALKVSCHFFPWLLLRFFFLCFSFCSHYFDAPRYRFLLFILLGPHQMGIHCAS